MAYKNQLSFIERLEKEQELIRVKTFVSPELEASEINDRVVKSFNKALLFEKTGTPFPLLMNAMGSEKRMCLALGVNHLEDIGKEIERIFSKLTSKQMGFFDKLSLLGELRDISKWMPKKISGKGACQEVIMEEPDLSLLPIIKCWPHDGGPFITLPAVHTIDPESGITNIGMYRMQVYDKKTTGMHWHMHKDAARHFELYKKEKKKMPVSVIVGGDPVYAYVASAPLPENINEYILAGFLRKKRVALVKCLTNDIYVPADADFVFEGYIDPEEDFRTEGPFGDHTGFYSLADQYPVFHVSCITHRKNAVYPATVVGIPPQEDAWMGKATERIFLAPIRLSLLPEVVDMVLPVEGVFHNIFIVKIHSTYRGHAFKVMNALWGAGQMMLNKMMIIVDNNVDINNYHEVFEAVMKNVAIDKDILISRGPLDVLDHSTDSTGFGGKIGFDACSKEIIREPLKKTEVISEEIQKLKTAFKSIVDYNDTLVNQGYRILILSVKKEPNHTLHDLKKHIAQSVLSEELDYILFIEHLIACDDYKDVVWRSANNVEPARDCELMQTPHAKGILFIDATMKSQKGDNFKKDWPNIICASEETIALVDKKWNDYNLGPFVVSPSKKYIPLKYSDGAIVDDNNNTLK